MPATSGSPICVSQPRAVGISQQQAEEVVKLWVQSPSSWAPDAQLDDSLASIRSDLAVLKQTVGVMLAGMFSLLIKSVLT